jgi:Tfp pilus assembly major pilin PilA
MALCEKCGKEVQGGEIFCRHCGARLLSQQASPSGFASTGKINDEDYALFIGKNSDKYLAKFKKFNLTGEDSFAATWHWPAFFVPFFWLLYRKLYLWALLVFIVGLIPYVGFAAMVVFGISANYLYYTHAKNKLLEVKTAQPPASDVQRVAAIARRGGVNSLVVIIPVVMIPVIAILAAIAIPQFAAYRVRAYDIQARSQLQAACTGAAAFFTEHPEKTELRPEDLLSTRYSPSSDINLMLLDGRRESFSMNAKHVRGGRTYTADQFCTITEGSRK